MLNKPREVGSSCCALWGPRTTPSTSIAPPENRDLNDAGVPVVLANALVFASSEAAPPAFIAGQRSSQGTTAPTSHTSCQLEAFRLYDADRSWDRLASPCERLGTASRNRQPQLPRDHRVCYTRARPAPLDRPWVARLAVPVGVALAVARLGVGAATAAHALVAGLHRPRLLPGRALEVRLDRRRRAAEPIGDLLDRQALELPVMACQSHRATALCNPIGSRVWRVANQASDATSVDWGFHRGRHNADRPGSLLPAQGGWLDGPRRSTAVRANRVLLARLRVAFGASSGTRRALLKR